MQQAADNLHMFLGELHQYKHQAPFDSLCDYLPIDKFKNSVLSPQLYNELFANKLKRNENPISFVDQQVLDDSNLYYEAFIKQHAKVPSRANWHDFFNALVWSQLPNTKTTFNRLHNQEISLHGVKNRTAIRDRLTHFDECGLVIFTNKKQLKDSCAQHDWTRLFVEYKDSWKNNAIVLIVGHAIWEMLLNPFIGLTGKVMFIEVETDALKELSSNIEQHEYKKMDNIINQHLLENCIVEQNKPWLPLPVLGIPGWSIFPQTEEFYSNKNYFMPRACPKKSKPSKK